MGAQTVGRLTDADISRLSSAELTYPEVGSTAAEPPPGYHHLREERAIGRGAARFQACGSSVLRWQIQLRSGFTVDASDHMAEGATAMLGIGVGRLRHKAPVRVVYVVDEDRRQGFAYGTLPGHPESGEELFCVEHRADDSVVLAISAFSTPNTPLAKIAGPLGRIGQRVITARYLRALDGL